MIEIQNGVFSWCLPSSDCVTSDPSTSNHATSGSTSNHAACSSTSDHATSGSTSDHAASDVITSVPMTSDASHDEADVSQPLLGQNDKQAEDPPSGTLSLSAINLTVKQVNISVHSCRQKQYITVGFRQAQVCF